MRNNLDKFVEKIKTHSLCSVTFSPPESRVVCKIMLKTIVEPEQTTDDNIVHAHCMLGT
jgi:hypothetical protein